MTLRCPVCRAENPTGPACRRCRADLSLLAAVEARRDFHLSRARTSIAEQRFDVAQDDLDQAEQLRAGADVHRLRACLHLSAGDFPAAWAVFAGNPFTVSCIS